MGSFKSDNGRLALAAGTALHAPRPWENASEEVATRCSSQGVGAETAVEDCREWLDRGDQVLSAAISGPTPKTLIIRLRL